MAILRDPNHMITTGGEGQFFWTDPPIMCCSDLSEGRTLTDDLSDGPMAQHLRTTILMDEVRSLHSSKFNEHIYKYPIILFSR